MLPKFKYHPNCYQNTFVKAEKNQVAVCQCCNNQTDYYYERMYASEDIDCLCPACISSGLAAEKYNGSFVDIQGSLVDNEKNEELFNRTPGILTWQSDYWFSCCDDYCAFIDYVGISELEELGIKEEVLADYKTLNEFSIELVEAYLHKEGDVLGYLFRCLHCGKYHLWVDAS